MFFGIVSSSSFSSHFRAFWRSSSLLPLPGLCEVYSLRPNIDCKHAAGKGEKRGRAVLHSIVLKWQSKEPELMRERQDG